MGTGKNNARKGKKTPEENYMELFDARTKTYKSPKAIYHQMHTKQMMGDPKFVTTKRGKKKPDMRAIKNACFKDFDALSKEEQQTYINLQNERNRRAIANKQMVVIGYFLLEKKIIKLELAYTRLLRECKPEIFSFGNNTDDESKDRTYVENEVVDEEFDAKMKEKMFDDGNDGDDEEEEAEEDVDDEPDKKSKRKRHRHSEKGDKKKKKKKSHSKKKKKDSEKPSEEPTPSVGTKGVPANSTEQANKDDSEMKDDNEEEEEGEGNSSEATSDSDDEHERREHNAKFAQKGVEQPLIAPQQPVPVPQEPTPQIKTAQVVLQSS